jgi:ribosomal protein S27AE
MVYYAWIMPMTPIFPSIQPCESQPVPVPSRRFVYIRDELFRLRSPDSFYLHPELRQKLKEFRLWRCRRENRAGRRRRSCSRCSDGSFTASSDKLEIPVDYPSDLGASSVGFCL